MWAVEQDATGDARGIALAYGRAIGCGRAGLIASSFAEEAEADLFNEQAVVWGGIPELLIAGFETLVAGGISPEVAYLECVGELQLIAELIQARGIAGMREAISNTAELGAVLGGKRIVDQAFATGWLRFLRKFVQGGSRKSSRPRKLVAMSASKRRAARLDRHCSSEPIGDSAARQAIGSAELHFGPVADACPLEIGALQLAMSFGQPGSAAALGQLLLLGRAAREIDPVLGGHRALLSGSARLSRNVFAKSHVRRGRRFGLARSIASTRIPLGFLGMAPACRPAPICRARGPYSG